MRYFFLIPLYLFLVFSSNTLSAYSSDEYRKQCIQQMGSCGFQMIDFGDELNVHGSYAVGRSLGINENYGTVGISYARCLPSCTIGPVGDLSFLIFNDITLGVSVEGGARFNFKDVLVTGLGLSYDYREGQAGHFNQLGVKFELLSKFFDFVANGYFPVGNTVQKKMANRYDDYDNFGAETPYKVYVYQREYSLTGFDLEGGFRYCQCAVSGYAGIGGYFFKRESYVNDWGVKGRLRFEYGKFIAIDGQVTHDGFSHTKGRVTFELNLPFDTLCNFCSALCCPCPSQRRTPRDRPIHLDNYCWYETNY